MPQSLQPERLALIKLLKSIDLGSSVAEHDTILYEARIETQAFTDLFRDRVDLICGTKGSGKTALYRLISEFEQSVMLKTRVVILTGVEASGDPVFLAFRKQFEELTELEFENFWRVYFVALVLERFVKNEQFQDALALCQAEVSAFKERCKSAKIPELNKSWSFRDIVQSVLQCVSVSVGNIKHSEQGTPSYSLVSLTPTKGHSPTEPNDGECAPIFLHDIHSALVEMLKASKLKLWIMLDRLDRFSPGEPNSNRLPFEHCSAPRETFLPKQFASNSSYGTTFSKMFS